MLHKISYISLSFQVNIQQILCVENLYGTIGSYLLLSYIYRYSRLKIIYNQTCLYYRQVSKDINESIFPLFPTRIIDPSHLFSLLHYSWRFLQSKSMSRPGSCGSKIFLSVFLVKSLRSIFDRRKNSFQLTKFPLTLSYTKKVEIQVEIKQMNTQKLQECNFNKGLNFLQIPLLKTHSKIPLLIQ